MCIDISWKPALYQKNSVCEIRAVLCKSDGEWLHLKPTGMIRCRIHGK